MFIMNIMNAVKANQSTKNCIFQLKKAGTFRNPLLVENVVTSQLIESHREHEGRH